MEVSFSAVVIIITLLFEPVSNYEIEILKELLVTIPLSRHVI